RPRIDLEEEITLFDFLALVERGLLERPGYLGAIRRHPDRLDGPDRLDDQRHILPQDLTNKDRRRSAAFSAGTRRVPGLVTTAGQHEAGDQRAGQGGQPPKSDM